MMKKNCVSCGRSIKQTESHYNMYGNFCVRCSHNPMEVNRMIRPGPKSLSADDITRMRTMYEEGKSLRKIALAFGVTKEAIFARKKKARWQRNDP